MKCVVTCILCLFITLPCFTVVWGQIPDVVEDALPEAAEELLDDLGEPSPDTGTLRQGLRRMGEMAWELLTRDFRSSLRVAILLLCVVLLHGMTEALFEASSGGKMVHAVGLAFVIVVTMTTAGDMQTMIGTGLRTMEELDVLAKALLPTLAAAVAAGGAIVTSGVQQVGTVFFANLLLTLIRQILMPLVYCYIAAVTANAVLPQQVLKGLVQVVRKGITWLLTGSLVIFTGYLSITGTAATSADRVTLQLTRSAISTAVPVVGGIISRAADSLLAGAGLLKNALGVVGMLAVLATCLTPFISMGVQYLLYKLTAFLAGLSGGGRIVELIDALGSAFGLVLGMVGACAALLLISITSSVSVVIV